MCRKAINRHTAAKLSCLTQASHGTATSAVALQLMKYF